MDLKVPFKWDAELDHLTDNNAWRHRMALVMEYAVPAAVCLLWICMMVARYK